MQIVIQICSCRILSFSMFLVLSFDQWLYIKGICFYGHETYKIVEIDGNKSWTFVVGSGRQRDFHSISPRAVLESRRVWYFDSQPYTCNGYLYEGPITSLRIIIKRTIAEFDKITHRFFHLTVTNVNHSSPSDHHLLRKFADDKNSGNPNLNEEAVATQKLNKIWNFSQI